MHEMAVPPANKITGVFSFDVCFILGAVKTF